MRINKFIAGASDLSRRKADQAIIDGRVKINNKVAQLGDTVTLADIVSLDEQTLAQPEKKLVIMLNKPTGYVCSRDGQGSQTIYDLLPTEYRRLKPIGRLDKDSSGLLLLTDDGNLANELTHPKYAKTKLYEVKLDKPLSSQDEKSIHEGVKLEDGLSQLRLQRLATDGSKWQVKMSEGRNRQIRRTFSSLGYSVRTLNRLSVGDYKLNDLPKGEYRLL